MLLLLFLVVSGDGGGGGERRAMQLKILERNLEHKIVKLCFLKFQVF